MLFRLEGFEDLPGPIIGSHDRTDSDAIDYFARFAVTGDTNIGFIDEMRETVEYFERFYHADLLTDRSLSTGASYFRGNFWQNMHTHTTLHKAPGRTPGGTSLLQQNAWLHHITANRSSLRFNLKPPGYPTQFQDRAVIGFAIKPLRFQSANHNSWWIGAGNTIYSDTDYGKTIFAVTRGNISSAWAESQIFASLQPSGGSLEGFGTLICRLAHNLDGTFRVSGHLSDHPLYFDVWNYLEMEFDWSESEPFYNLWINGQLALRLEGEAAALVSSQARHLNRLHLGYPGNRYVNNVNWTYQSFAWAIDDLYVLDGSGPEFNRRLGSIQVVTRFPDASPVDDYRKNGLSFVTPYPDLDGNLPLGYEVSACGEQSSIYTASAAFIRRFGIGNRGIPAWRSTLRDSEGNAVSISPETPHWIQIKLPEPVTVAAFEIRTSNALGLHPLDFQLLGSSNGEDWQVLHSVTDSQGTIVNTVTLYEIAQEYRAPYRYYRLSITRSGSTYVIISQLNLLRLAAEAHQVMEPYYDPERLTLDTAHPESEALFTSAAEPIPIDNSEIEIVGVVHTQITRITEGDTEFPKVVLKSGSEEVEQTTETVANIRTGLFQRSQVAYERDPNGNKEWTPEAVKATQFGFRMPPSTIPR